MEGVRLYELPACRMASSGLSSIETGMAGFDQWFSAVDRERADRFYPRDFMWYDEANRGMVWYYALPPGRQDAGPFAVVDFPGGLFAAAVSVDANDTDGERVYAGIKEWVEAQPGLAQGRGQGLGRGAAGAGTREGEARRPGHRAHRRHRIPARTASTRALPRRRDGRIAACEPQIGPCASRNCLGEGLKSQV